MTENAIPAYADPDHPLNGEAHRSGRVCIEPGCGRPAGTVWSPLWCQIHNAERMDRIGRALDAEIAYRTGGTS